MHKEIIINTIRAILLFLLSIVIICILKINIDDAQTERKRRLYESQGKANIERYIEEKYGFKPEIKRVVSVYKSDDTFESLYSKSDINKYIEGLCSNGYKTFIVITNGDSDNISETVDNYQYYDIKEGLDKYIENKLEIPIKDYLVTYGKRTSNFGIFKSNKNVVETHYLVSSKFDGANYKDILTDYNNSIEIITCCDTIKNITESDIKQTFGDKTGNIYIYNVATIDDVLKLHNTIEDLKYVSNKTAKINIKEVIYANTNYNGYIMYKNKNTGETVELADFNIESDKF